jgi:hypothetical protein
MRTCLARVTAATSMHATCFNRFETLSKEDGTSLDVVSKAGSTLLLQNKTDCKLKTGKHCRVPCAESEADHWRQGQGSEFLG